MDSRTLQKYEQVLLNDEYMTEWRVAYEATLTEGWQERLRARLRTVGERRKNLQVDRRRKVM